MSNFVEEKLKEWDLSEYIEKFKGNFILFLLIERHNNLFKYIIT